MDRIERGAARALVFLCVLGLLAGGATAQRRGEPVVSAQLSTGVARLGEAVSLSVVAENARQASIVRVPKVEGLALGRPAGPYRSQHTQFVNGRMSERIETSWRIAIRAADEGTFEIPSIVLEVDGRRMKTRPVTLKVLRDLRGEDVGFFEIRPSSRKVVEGQPFTLELRFGWDGAASVNYANLSLPWWGALPGTIDLEGSELPQDSDQVVVNDVERVRVERLRSQGDGRVVYRLVKSFLPVRSGSLELPTSFLEFGKVSEARLFSTQRKLASYFVPAAGFDLEVVPLPAEGQPFDYSGAVGSLEVRAAADTRDLVVGDSIKLTLDWTGAGNLEFFEAPDLALLDSFDGFQVYGTTQEKSFDRRRVIYDLAPLSDSVEEIPSVPLSVFDPDGGRYVTVASGPIPIRVRPLERALALGEEDERFARDILDIDTLPLGTTGGGAPAGPSQGLLVGAFLGLPLLWLLGRTLVRRRVGDPSAPLARRRRRARRELTRALARDDGARGLLEAFLAFLSARTREPAEVWSGRDVVSWAAEAGELEPETARETAGLLQRLEAAVYGGDSPVRREEVLALADRLGRAGL
jgi:hypothetical protein